MLHTAMLSVACTLLAAASPPTDAARDDDAASSARAAELVKDLADPMKAGGAANKLFDLGVDAVPALATAVRSSTDLYARAEAIKTLSWMIVPDGPGRDAALAVLEDAGDDATLPLLVRTWANAALIGNAYPLDELQGMAALLETNVALERPFSSRAQQLTYDLVLAPELPREARSAQRQRAWAVLLLEGGTIGPQVQRALFPALAALEPAVLVDIVREGRTEALRRLAAEHIVSMARRRSDASMTAALDALRSTPFADAPALASVDDPRATRERPRTSYLHTDNGIASLAILPEVRHGHERVAMLLAFPASPGAFLVPPTAFDGLAAMAKLDGSLEERAPLLPVSYAYSDSWLINDRDDLRRWAEHESIPLDERELSAAERYLAAEWTLLGVVVGSPSSPMGFRFYAREPTLPPDLLADEHEWQRLFLVTASKATLAGSERPIRARLPPAELKVAMSGARAELVAARDLLRTNHDAARERTLSTVEDFREADILLRSRGFGLSAADTTLLLRSGTRTDNPREDVSLWLTVLEGDLSDGVLRPEGEPATPPVEAVPLAEPATPADDESGSPLVRRFQGNRIFGLLQKIWNDDDENEPASVQPPSNEEQPDGAAE